MLVFSATAWLRVAVAGLLGLAVLSCDSPAAPAPVVVVTPSGIIPLNVGDTITVRAVVQNATQPAVRFTSSNSAVAAVNESTGLVEALAAGEATITATSVQDSDASASVQVVVQDLPSSVVIAQILNSAGALIDPTSVKGNINVQLAVELGGATRLDVLVDTAIACQQTFLTGTSAPAVRSNAAAPSATITCPVNTAAFTAATGVPKFLNGQVNIRARLVGADGRTRSETAGFPLVLANTDTLVYQVLATKRANDAAGLQWISGSLTVNILPVMFSRTSLVQTELHFEVPGWRVHRRMDTTLPFSMVFEEDSVRNVTHDRLVIFVRTATAEGQPGPTVTSSPLRYDSQPPLPGTVVPRDWMGAQSSFADRHQPAEDADRGGVGRVSARFFAGDPILSDSALVGRGKLVTTGSDLQPGPYGSYRAAALVCDALDNCTLGKGFKFGVDLTPPTVESLTLKDRAINPPGDFTVAMADDLSGLQARALEATVTALDADPSTPACGPGVDGVDLPGRLVSGSCLPDTVGTSVPVPTSRAGYYTYTLTPLDRAGNRGTTVTRRILVDHSAPELTGLTVPGQYLPGDEGSFTASATDNVDLVDVTFRLRFPGSAASGAIALPFSIDSVPVGTAFDGTITTEGARTSRFPVVRALTTVIGAVRATVLVDSLQVQAIDAAGLTSKLSRGISLGGSTPTLDPFATATTVDPTRLDATQVCTGGCIQNDRTTLPIKMRIAGTSALTQPFARVYYYRHDLVTGTVTLLGSGATVEGLVEGGQASFVYSFTYTPPAGLEGEYSIFAVGVNSAGYALRNEGRTVSFYKR